MEVKKSCLRAKLGFKIHFFNLTVQSLIAFKLYIKCGMGVGGLGGGRGGGGKKVPKKFNASMASMLRSNPFDWTLIYVIKIVVPIHLTWLIVKIQRDSNSNYALRNSSYFVKRKLNHAVLTNTNLSRLLITKDCF